MLACSTKSFILSFRSYREWIIAEMQKIVNKRQPEIIEVSTRLSVSHLSSVQWGKENILLPSKTRQTLQHKILNSAQSKNSQQPVLDHHMCTWNAPAHPSPLIPNGGALAHTLCAHSFEFRETLLWIRQHFARSLLQDSHLFSNN